MIQWVAIYFVLSVAGLGLLLFGRRPVGPLVQRILDWFGHRLRAGRAGPRDPQRAPAKSAPPAGRPRWRRQGPWLLLALALLLAPPLLMLALRDQHRLEGFAEPTLEAPSGPLAELLRGEQLVAPPPLPPEVFTTAEVEQVRPALASADRRWDQLDADFEQRLLLVIKLMRERHGYEVALLEGVRSPQRQAMLAALGPSVTNAGAWQSWHQYGLAADCAFVRDGRLVISERDPWAMRGYQLYGELAESVGLRWGGRWKLMDFGHVELPKPGVKKPL